MASLLYLLGPPLLLLISIPLAIFAVLTTTIAFSTLTLRVSIVYFELGLALIHSYLFPPSPTSIKHPKPSSPRRTSPQRPRNRRTSAASTTSSADTALPSHPPRLHNKSGSFASLIGTGEPNRDFEGVGGWRVSGDDDEEALWMGMNSRLELPAVIPKRKHQRSLTGGSQRWSWSPEAMRMSPMQSRARTPTGSGNGGRGEEKGEDYFGGSGSCKYSDPTGRLQQMMQEGIGGGAGRRKSGSSEGS
ncbi:hypothetical protein K469DRAFT_704188 [Zopfia rhizophila CBS 207.26]|uniref:Uncharacterized protein n=1 Tax=Zopfia rhizophila CBS 207.26 TaxID=1314779 RepID=A0A6A6EDM0_9PEZI|nr:hypothetical protein K469DRAFT_704188 [Zopfia rhizophila CBS 207.26]